jgi:Uma2 family endonuclease
MNSATRTTKPPKRKPQPATESVPIDLGPMASRLKRFALADYHRMIESGVIREEERCEFINGQVFSIMPPNPPHAHVTRALIQLLAPLFARPDWVVGVQDPVTLTENEPQPDFYAAVGPNSRYRARLPGPRDLVLLVEVSDTSIEFDTETKLALYAGDKIPQYWIVNIPERRVEVYTQPRGGRNPTYRPRADYGQDASVPVVVAGKTFGTIPVRELLP